MEKLLKDARFQYFKCSFIKNISLYELLPISMLHFVSRLSTYPLEHFINNAKTDEIWDFSYMMENCDNSP